MSLKDPKRCLKKIITYYKKLMEIRIQTTCGKIESSLLNDQDKNLINLKYDLPDFATVLSSSGQREG